MVTTPDGHVVARVGGQAELRCQVTPPRSVEHMEVRWFRSDNLKLVYQYRGGHEVNRKSAPEYVNRTEFVTEDIGKGRVTLRIHNISISDDGLYQCLFNDSGFSDMASMNVSVTAFGLKTQIHVESPGYSQLIVRCLSEGWFPQPRMEWRDSQGEIVPYSSISHSQDGDRFFHMKMILLLRNQSQESITCCQKKDYTLQEDFWSTRDHLVIEIVYFMVRLLRTSTYLWKIMFVSCSLRANVYTARLKASLIPCSCQLLNLLSFICAFPRIYFLFSISDPLFSLYNSWMTDMVTVIRFLLAIFTVTIIALLFTHQKLLQKQ
ncbi:selection and upkeep of intraepithelial T-cells protein 8-like, partial [Sigmodon hispidus]